MFAEAGSPDPIPRPPPAVAALAAAAVNANAKSHAPAADDSLFERFPWLYAFFRERVFRDDTEGIIAALWPAGEPPVGSWLVEVGCGPGFYSRRLAARFPGLRVLGVDRSRAQLHRASRLARRAGLENCRFERADALALDRLLPAGTADAILAARLFTILPQRERALDEMHRALRPGGRCFLAEPSARFTAKVPLRMMWLLAQAGGFFGDFGVYREPAHAAVFTPTEFNALVQSQPWGSVWRWQDGHYQYALCEKAGSPPATPKPGHAPEDYTI